MAWMRAVRYLLNIYSLKQISPNENLSRYMYISGKIKIEIITSTTGNTHYSRLKPLNLTMFRIPRSPCLGTLKAILYMSHSESDRSISNKNARKVIALLFVNFLKRLGRQNCVCGVLFFSLGPCSSGPCYCFASLTKQLTDPELGVT